MEQERLQLIIDAVNRSRTALRELREDVDRAKRAVDEFNKSADRLNRGAGGGGGTAGAARGFRALGDVIGQVGRIAGTVLSGMLGMLRMIWSALQMLLGILRSVAGMFASAFNLVLGLLGQVAGAAMNLAGIFGRTLLGAAQRLFGFLGTTAKVAAAGAAAALFLVGKRGLEVNLIMDRAQKAFTVMLGSQRRAAGLMQEITTAAAKTTFSLVDLIDKGKTLVAFGFQARQIVPMLKTIGDTAFGLGGPNDAPEKLHRIIIALGQIKSRGSLMAGEALQLQEAGINVREAVGLPLGKDFGDVKIPAEEAIEKILAHMQQKFGGLMAAEADSITGRLSNIGDAFDQLARKVTRGFAERVRQALGNVLQTLQQFEQTAAGQAVMRLFTETFNRLGDAALWASQQLPRVLDWLVRIFQSPGAQAFAATVTGAFSALVRFLIQTGTAILVNWQSLWPQIRDGAIMAISVVVGWVQVLAQEAMGLVTGTAGGTLLGMIWETFKDMAVGALDFVLRVWNGLVAAVTFFAQQGPALWGLVSEGIMLVQSALELAAGTAQFFLGLLAIEKIAGITQAFINLGVAIAGAGGALKGAGAGAAAGAGAGAGAGALAGKAGLIGRAGLVLGSLATGWFVGQGINDQFIGRHDRDADAAFGEARAREQSDPRLARAMELRRRRRALMRNGRRNPAIMQELNRIDQELLAIQTGAPMAGGGPGGGGPGGGGGGPGFRNFQPTSFGGFAGGIQGVGRWVQGAAGAEFQNRMQAFMTSPAWQRAVGLGQGGIQAFQRGFQTGGIGPLAERFEGLGLTERAGSAAARTRDALHAFVSRFQSHGGAMPVVIQGFDDRQAPSVTVDSPPNLFQQLRPMQEVAQQVAQQKPSLEAIEAKVDYIRARIEGNPALAQQIRDRELLPALQEQMRALSEPQPYEGEKGRFRRLAELERIKGELSGFTGKDRQEQLRNSRDHFQIAMAQLGNMGPGQQRQFFFSHVLPLAQKHLGMLETEYPGFEEDPRWASGLIEAEQIKTRLYKLMYGRSPAQGAAGIPLAGGGMLPFTGRGRAGRGANMGPGLPSLPMAGGLPAMPLAGGGGGPIQIVINLNVPLSDIPRAVAAELHRIFGGNLRGSFPHGSRS